MQNHTLLRGIGGRGGRPLERNEDGGPGFFTAGEIRGLPALQRHQGRRPMRRQTTSQFPLSPGGWPHHGRLPRPARPLCRHEQWSRFRPSGRPNGCPRRPGGLPVDGEPGRSGAGGNGDGERVRRVDVRERERGLRGAREKAGSSSRRGTKRPADPTGPVEAATASRNVAPRASEHIDGQLQIN